jgi:hypothetical protein
VGVVAIATRGVNERAGGVALAGLTLKPHVVLLVFFEAFLRAIRERRFVSVALAVAIAGALALAALVVDPAWPRSWGMELLGTRREMLPRQATAWSLAADIFGDGRLGALLILSVAAGAIWTLRRRRMSGADRMALAVCGSLLITPYAGSHDQILLALPWAIILATAIELPPPAGTWLLAALVLCSSLFPWTVYAYALRARPDEATAWLVTAATTLLLAVAIRKRSFASAPFSREESLRTHAHDRSRDEVSSGS